MQGVIRTRVGYAGGEETHPTYYDLGRHLETIQIDYDPSVVSYGDLLKVFWESHEPYRPPWKRQYASAIFYSNKEQKRLAEESMKQRSAQVGKKLYTEIAPLDKFWRAEDYHQKYQLRNTLRVMAELRGLYNNDKSFTDSTTAARLNGYLAGYGSRQALEAELPHMGLSAGLRDALLRQLSPRLEEQPEGVACPVQLGS